MSSMNGIDYEREYGTDHERAGREKRADKIYCYKALRSDELPITYKFIHSEEEERIFLNSQFVYDPKLIWEAEKD